MNKENHVTALLTLKKLQEYVRDMKDVYTTNIGKYRYSLELMEKSINILKNSLSHKGESDNFLTEINTLLDSIKESTVN
jgi:hypothetical protein